MAGYSVQSIGVIGTQLRHTRTHCTPGLASAAALAPSWAASHQHGSGHMQSWHRGDRLACMFSFMRPPAGCCAGLGSPTAQDAPWCRDQAARVLVLEAPAGHLCQTSTSTQALLAFGLQHAAHCALDDMVTGCVHVHANAHRHRQKKEAPLPRPALCAGTHARRPSATLQPHEFRESRHALGGLPPRPSSFPQGHLVSSFQN